MSCTSAGSVPTTRTPSPRPLDSPATRPDLDLHPSGRKAGHAVLRLWTTDGVAKEARVARSVYVTAMEPGSGKSAVVLGLTEVLSRNAARLAFYRPFVAAADVPDPAIELIRHRYRLPDKRVQYALTVDDLHNLDGRDDYDALLKRILNGFHALADADIVVIEGSDFTEASLAVELDLNIDAASHLGSPVLLVVSGRRRTPEQVLDAVHQGLGTLAERGCARLGVICNRVRPELVEPIRAGIGPGRRGVAGGRDAGGAAAGRADHGRGGHPAGRRAPGPPGRRRRGHPARGHPGDRRSDGAATVPATLPRGRPGDHAGGPGGHRRRHPGRAPVRHLPARSPGSC